MPRNIRYFKREWLDLDIPKFAYFGMERAGHFAMLDWIHAQYIHKPTAHVMEGLVQKKERGRWFGKDTNDTIIPPVFLSIGYGPNPDPANYLNSGLPVILVIRDVRNMMASRFQRFKHNGRLCSKEHIDVWTRYAKQALGDMDYFNGNCLVIKYNDWFVNKTCRQHAVDIMRTNWGWEVLLNDEVKQWVARPAGGSSFDKMNYDGHAQDMQVLHRWEQSTYQHLITPMLTDEIRELDIRLFGEW